MRREVKKALGKTRGTSKERKGRLENIFVLERSTVVERGFEFFEYFEIQKIQNIQKIMKSPKKEVQRDFWEKFGGVVPFLRILLLF